MTDCATQLMRFETHSSLAVEAAFDGGRITSDGGVVWLAKMDCELGLCQRISEHVPEWRNRKGRHSLVWLIRQRIFQIERAATMTMTAPPLMPSMRRPWRQVGATTAVLGFDQSTMRATMGPSSSIQTATTLKRSAMGQNRKPNMPDPLFARVSKSGSLRIRLLGWCSHYMCEA
jgi:hypothetical protein